MPIGGTISGGIAGASAGGAIGAIGGGLAGNAAGNAFCPEDECDPPAGTQCYEYNTGHKHKGMDPHYHIWQMNKSPNGCFWNKKRTGRHSPRTTQRTIVLLIVLKLD